MAKTKTRRRHKGRFVKGGGSKALTRTRTRTITKYRTRRARALTHRRRGRRRSGGSGGVNAMKIGIAAVGLGALLADNSPIAPAKVKELVAKVPGAKTFGNVAVGGLAIGALGHFTNFGGRFRPWMKAAGVVGLVAALIKVGSENTGFKFVGDDDDDSLMDVETDD